MSKQQLYKIIRFYQDPWKDCKFIKRDLTFEQAQAHCKDPLTHKEGEWFDGYEVQ